MNRKWRGRVVSFARVHSSRKTWNSRCPQASPAAISVRADNFTATSATGSMTVLNAAPLRLRIDVTTSSSSGETMRIAGDAGFTYQKVDANCT
ncbi:MAG: hypothetical protein ABIW94_03275 [Gemmatimonadaceae bacterium]